MALKYQLEPLAHLLKTGLLEVGQRGFDETWGDEDGFEFDPDWERYQRMETENSARILAVRDGEKLVGYATLALHNALVDKKVRLCVIQDIFLDHEYRAGLKAGAVFMAKVEEIIGYLDVHVIIVAERTIKTGAFFEWLGYKCNERVHSKWIGGVKCKIC